MTATTKHTPGPWALEEVRTDCGRAFRIGSGEMLKAGKGCCIIYDDYPGNPENERKANARLIAAAPDLLEALEASLEEVKAWRAGLNTRNMNTCKEGARFSDLSRSRAAIAKARGEG